MNDLHMPQCISPWKRRVVVWHGHHSLVGERLEVDGCPMRGRIFLEKRIQLLKARLEGRSGELA